MTAGRGKTPADIQLWNRVVKDITPLRGKARRKAKIVDDTRPPAVKTAKPLRPAKPVKIEAAAAKPKPPPLPRLSVAEAPGLDNRSFEKLRRGKMGIEARLDLHGLTLDAAHRALVRFLDKSWERNLRTLLVITGKGGRGKEDEFDSPRATLRQSAPRWLNEPGLRSRILAFAQAQPKHGGSGALYVLLKRRRA